VVTGGFPSVSQTFVLREIAAAKSAGWRVHVVAPCSGSEADWRQAREFGIEEGDIEEALRAATAIGDDRLQMQSRGVVVPESFTHGNSEQRARWFFRGLKTGDMNQGDTFGAPYEEL